MLCGTSFAQSKPPEPYRVIYISTDSIKIGSKWCQEFDTIWDTDTVYWDKNLYDQAVKAEELKNTSNIKIMAKQQVLMKHKYSTSIRGLYGKGDYIDVVLKGESYPIKCEIDDNYSYKVFFKKEYDGVFIQPQNGCITLDWNLLEKYIGITEIKLYRVNNNNNLDINMVKTCIVDIMN